MSNSYSSTLSPYAQEIEDTRSPISVEIETITHHITLWYSANPKCQAEVSAYKKRLDLLDKQCGENDADSQYMLLFAVKDEYRSLFGRAWNGNR